MRKLILIGMIGAVTILGISLMTCSENNGVAPASFSTPGIYNGTYQYVQDWMVIGTDPYEKIDKVVFEFFGNGTFRMDIDTTEADQYFCVVDTGTFRYTGDSIYLEILSENLVPQVCAPGKGPQGDFFHSVRGNYLVFEIQDRDNHILKKIELIGN